MNQRDIDDLRELIEFLKEHGVAEFDVDRGDLKLRLKFNPPAGASTPLGNLALLSRTAPPAPDAPGKAGSAAELKADWENTLHQVKSPMVGTFYSAPSPDASPFVSPGDRVEKGQVIGIIEAMKLMNEIEADVTGEVVRCLATNGQAIEFGQPLFAIRTA